MRYRRAKATLGMGILLCLTPFRVDYQAKVPDGGTATYKVVSAETYKRVLDIVFSHGESADNHEFVLRFRPSFHGESQLSISRTGGAIEVRRCVSTSGSIYGLLNSLKANGQEENALEMAKVVKVEHRSLKVSNAEFEKWNGDFLRSVEPTLRALEIRRAEADRTGITRLALDGTFYDLWLRQDTSEVSFSFYDDEVSDRVPNGELKVVRWMNAVRQQIEKRN